MDFNFCFICLAQLKKVGVKRRRKQEDEKLLSNLTRFLTKYLLQSSEKNYDSVIKDVLKLNGVGADSRQVVGKNCSGSVLRLCEKCESLGGKVLEMHLELEKLQMKIIHEVRSMREAILRSSGWLGGRSVEDKTEEVFEHFSTKFCHGNGSSETVQIFSILKCFQAAISETINDSVRLPLVYLEKYGVGGNSTHFTEERTAIQVEVVKTEPLEQDPVFQDEFFDDDCNNHTPDVFSEDGIVSMKKERSSDINPKPRVKKVGRRIQKQRKMTPRRKRKRLATKRLQLPRIKRVLQQYSCQSCSFRCKQICNFEHHLREHETPEKVHHCDNCQQGFSTRQHYTLHLGRHRGAHKLRCDVCRNFANALELANHVKTHVDKTYPCPHCSHCSSSLQKYMAHIQRNHNQVRMKYSCELCDGGVFQSKKSYLDHLDQVHQAIEWFRCDFEGCNQVFFEEDLLNSHKVYHTGQFACKKCSRQFSTQASLEVHQQTHTIEKNVKCDHCQECFGTSEALQTHMIREHGAAKLKCEDCGKEYTSTSGLHFHMVMSHNGKGKYCPMCNKKCATTYRLKRHMQSHSDRKNFVCEECGKWFRSHENCQNHKRIHKEKKFQCSHCPKAFHMGKYLRQHLVSHTREKAHVCDKCGKGFSRLQNLSSHNKKCLILQSKQTARKIKELKRATAAANKSKSSNKSVTNNDNHICDECGNVFRTLRRCQVHKRLHREKNYKCPYCPKAFAINKYLICHIRIHTGDKPFQCDECGKVYTQCGSLLTHKKKCQGQGLFFKSRNQLPQFHQSNQSHDDTEDTNISTFTHEIKNVTNFELE